MHVSDLAAVAITATAAVLLSSGCSTNKPSTATPTSATPASATSASSTAASDSPTAGATQDYSALLVKESDLSPPGAPAFTAAPPTSNPFDKPGVATTFTSADGADVIGDTILILPDAATATGVLQASIQSLGQSVTGGAPTHVAVGIGGVMQSGMSPDGTKAVTVVLFTEGTASVTLEFDGPTADPVTPEYATMVAQKQDDAIKTGLPG